jgi:hypothetical protein
MNADTLTSYGVECLLRLKGVQVTQINAANLRSFAFICGSNSPSHLSGDYKLILIVYSQASPI